MSDRCAPRHTTKVFTVADAAGALTISSGQAVHVYGMNLYAGTAAAVFVITDAADAVISRVAVGANSSVEVTVPWIADAGVKVQVSAVAGSPTATVFHNSAGR
jgi:hypothetical protein